MLIDTHCHLNDNEYKNLDNLIDEILTSEVKKFIVSGYDIESSNNAIALSHKYNNVYATVGFHPSDSGKIEEADYDMFNQWLKDEKVVGVGEIGLDYYHAERDKSEQIVMFERQIDIAIKHNKPIVVHNRNAGDDVYNLLKNKKAKGIIHCFSDNLEMANKFIELGFLLGVGGIITFKNNSIKDVIECIPLSSIVLETDSPYLAPDPFRGKQNSPLYLPLVAGAIAKAKNIEYNEVASVTTSNAMHLFDFKFDL